MKYHVPGKINLNTGTNEIVKTLCNLQYLVANYKRKKFYFL